MLAAPLPAGDPTGWADHRPAIAGPQGTGAMPGNTPPADPVTRPQFQRRSKRARRLLFADESDTKGAANPVPTMRGIVTARLTASLVRPHGRGGTAAGR